MHFPDKYYYWFPIDHWIKLKLYHASNVLPIHSPVSSLASSLTASPQSLHQNVLLISAYILTIPTEHLHAHPKNVQTTLGDKLDTQLGDGEQIT